MKINVAIVEDEKHYNNALKKIIDYDADLHCVGQFYNGNEAIVNLVELKPDVILMDIKLPDMSGIEVMSKIKPLMEESHFIDVYDHSLEIVDYKHKICVVKDQGVRKGIYFCDLIYNTRYCFDKWFYRRENITTTRNQLKIKELWFVSVVESLMSDDLTDSRAFVQKNGVKNLYDQIFYFNFSQSIIKKIN